MKNNFEQELDGVEDMAYIAANSSSPNKQEKNIWVKKITNRIKGAMSKMKKSSTNNASVKPNNTSEYESDIGMEEMIATAAAKVPPLDISALNSNASEEEFEEELGL